MKYVNLINTISPNHQRGIRRWFLLSLMLLLCTIFAVTSLSLPTYIELRNRHAAVNELHEKTKDYDMQVKKYAALQKEMATLQQKKAAINRYINNPANPYDHLKTIIDACGTAIKLEQIRLIKNEGEIIVHCASPEKATKLINTLSESKNFSGLKLTSLQKDAQKNELRVVIKGTLN